MSQMSPRTRTARWLAVAAFAAGAAQLGACSKETNVTANGGGAGTGGGSSQPQLPDCTDAGTSPGTRGPAMVVVGRTDGTCHFMDATEVTRGDYEQFLAAPDRPASQDVPCAWNDSLDPDATCEAKATVTRDPTHPRVCVDWCDAAAYCEWAGKVLCPGTFTTRPDPAKSTWYSACSHGGASTFPYGNDYDAEVCNGQDRSTGTTVPVEQGIACVTPTGVRGMSGNAAEWTAECEDSTGASDACRAYGGSFKKTSAGLTCAAPIEPERSTVQDDLGFRCCAAAG